MFDEAGGRNPGLARGTDDLGGDGGIVVGVVCGGVSAEVLREDGDELAPERGEDLFTFILISHFILHLHLI